MFELPYAEDVNYWQTSRTGSETWLAKTRKQIVEVGGRVLAEAFGMEHTSGRSAYMMTFEIGGEVFRATWPALPSRTNKEAAARVQAATMLYHDVKARCMKVKVFGARVAFFDWLLLPDGRTAVEASNVELALGLPKLLQQSGSLLLEDGE